MAQLLALEWNDDEARLAVAASRGSQAVIEQAFSLKLEPAASGSDPEESNVGRRIAAALAARGIGRLDTLVAVGRANIELRLLELPPAPDAELPALVRFQAMRELGALEEDWPLDFIPLDDVADQPRNVLAAAIDSGLVEQIQHTCRGAGLKPQRLILRPCAAASLLRRGQDADQSEVRLLIDLLGDEADLTALSDRKVVFLRTVRLGGDPLAATEHSGGLLAEIRRTMAAVRNQLDGRRVESLVLCGTGPEHVALAELFHERLQVRTELFDPFAGVKLGAELREGLPDEPGRFAPLLGMLLDELDQAPHAIDFLHPRRPPEPPTTRVKYLLAGVAAIALIGLVFLLGPLQRWRLEGEIADLQRESKSLDKQVAAAAKVEQAVREIEKWTGTEVVWLDELRRLCEKLPSAEDVMLTKLILSLSSHGGEIQIDGLARTYAAIDEIEKSLHEDKSHHVTPGGTSQDDSTKPYARRFSVSVSVIPGKLSTPRKSRKSRKS